MDIATVARNLTKLEGQQVHVVLVPQDGYNEILRKPNEEGRRSVHVTGELEFDDRESSWMICAGVGAIQFIVTDVVDIRQEQKGGTKEVVVTLTW